MEHYEAGIAEQVLAYVAHPRICRDLQAYLAPDVLCDLGLVLLDPQLSDLCQHRVRRIKLLLLLSPSAYQGLLSHLI